MENSDKLFKGFLRLVISELRAALAEPEAARQARLEALLNNLQRTLED